MAPHNPGVTALRPIRRRRRQTSPNVGPTPETKRKLRPDPILALYRAGRAGILGAIEGVNVLLRERRAWRDRSITREGMDA